MADAEYIKRGFDTTPKAENEKEDYVKIEIIRHNPYLYYLTYPNGKNGVKLVNTKETKYLGMKGWISKNSNDITISFTYDVKQEAGNYTFDILWAVPLSSNGNNRIGKWQNTINGKKGTKHKMKIKDNNYQRSQSSITLKKGKNTFKLSFNKNMIILGIELRKLDYYTGDTNNACDEGTSPLTLTKFNIKKTGDYEIAEMTAELFYSEKYKDDKAENGLVFNYRDEVNLYIMKNMSKPYFGGYISSADVDDDLTTINLNCADRLIDAKHRYLTTDIVLDNGESDNIRKSYKSYPEVLSHLLQTVENNIESNMSTAKKILSRKAGLKSIMTIKGNGKRVTTNKMKKYKLKKDDRNITLQNSGGKSTNDKLLKTSAILWDHKWHGENVNLKDYPTFYLKYGLGKKVTKTKVKKKLKSGKYSKKKTSVTTGGFDKDKPFQAYIRIQFSYDYTNTKGKLVRGYSKKAKRHNAYINFTKDFANVTYHLGSIKPVFSNNTIREGNLNIYNVLATGTNKSNIYIKQIAFLNTHNKEALYDKKTKKSACKILLSSCGVRKGLEINPESLGTSGKTILDSLKTVGEKSGLRMKLEYGKRRFSDKSIFFVNTDQDIDPKLSFREDTHYFKVSNIKFKPIESYINTTIKVYKAKKEENKDTIINKFIATRSISNMFRFGEHMDLEVLSDNVGSKMAYYLAKNDPDLNTGLNFSYTLTIEDFYNLNLGDMVECIFYQAYLNDIKTVESIEINYEKSSITMVLGMDEPARNIRILKQNQKNRTLAKTKNNIFYGGAEWDDSIDNMVW